MYTEYAQEEEFRWLELYSRLSELWQLCYVPDPKRTISPTYDPEKHTNKDFDKISAEISRLDSLLSARKDVLDALTAWKEKWAEKLALEEKKKNPEYYRNRGRENNVHMDARKERILNGHTLPKLSNTLKDAYENYRKSHPGDEIRIDGLTPSDYVKWVMDEYNASKELERKNRLLKRSASSCSLATSDQPQSSRSKLSQRSASSSKIDTLGKNSSPMFSTRKMGSSEKRKARSAAKASQNSSTPLRPSNKPPRLR